MEFMTKDLRFDVSTKKEFSKMRDKSYGGRKWTVERKGHNHPGPKIK